MTSSARRPSDALPTPSAYFLLALEQVGTTPALREALLAGTGVSPQDAAALGEEITVGQQLQQVRNANRILPPGWGLAVGAKFQAAAHGSLGFGAVSAATLGDALALLDRFAYVRAPLFGFRLVPGARETRLELLQRVELQEEEFLPVLETFLMGVQALVESVLGREIGEARMEVAATPPYAERYRDYLHPSLHFGAEVSALVVPNAWLERRCPLADPAMYELSVRKLEAMAARLEGERYTAALVEELMARGDDAGPSLDEVAKALGLSSRTLTRRLGEVNTSYRDIRDAHRSGRARELLARTTLTNAEIAYRLGYEDPSNFRRACVRWFGKPPGALRGQDAARST